MPSRAACRASRRAFTIAGTKALTVHAKWIGRYDRRGVKLRHGSVLSTPGDASTAAGLMVLVMRLT